MSDIQASAQEVLPDHRSLITGVTRKTGLCSYCEEPAVLNGVCDECEPVVPLVDRSLAEGRVEENDLWQPAIIGHCAQRGCRCVVCGREIEGQHTYYRINNPHIGRECDNHFHRRCAAVWELRAARA